MNRRFQFGAAIVLGLAGCAETPVVTDTGPKSAMPQAIRLPQGVLVPSLETPTCALDGVRRVLRRSGFDYDVTDQVSNPADSSLVAMTNRPGDPNLCGGTAEVVAVAVVDQWNRTMLNLSCQTQHLMPPPNPGDPCHHTDHLGCPVAGDRLVAEIALNAIDTL